MKQNYSQVSAYVLHSRDYQENSQIIQLFSLEVGRFSVIAKGIKGKRSQARKAVLQPFSELKIEYTGKSDLKTLLQCDIFVPDKGKISSLINLQGKSLACGYYANELLLRACPERHEFPQLFFHYREFIQLLKSGSFESVLSVAPALRNFEAALLTGIGLAPDWRFDTQQNEIAPDKRYLLIPEYGFQLDDGLLSEEVMQESCEEPSGRYPNQLNKFDSYPGQAILSLASGIHYPEHYKSSQQIMAVFLREVIGNKPLQSRKLWQHLNLNDDSFRKQTGK